MRGRWKDEGVGWFQTRLTLLCTSLATVQRVVAAVDDDDDDDDDDVMDGSRCLMTTLPSHQNIHHNICLHSSPSATVPIIMEESKQATVPIIGGEQQGKAGQPWRPGFRVSQPAPQLHSA